jgi:large subunit ribosomal protein L10
MSAAERSQFTLVFEQSEIMLTRKQKETIVEELTNAFKANDGVLMLDYQGVDASGIVELRKRVRAAGGQMQVVKKTLLKRAFTAADLQVPNEEVFEGQTGVVYGFEDPVGVAKVLAGFRKELVQTAGDEAKVTFAVRGGVLDGNILLAADARALATIPSREELIAKAVGSIASPLRGLVGVLSGPQRSFVYALNAVAQAKS